ncbi:MAG: F0F1 ATP synthase subunit gamma [Gammaproteobacteria bacterium]
MKATRKITKAMQMVAAAKLRRAQEAAVAARPYSERMSTVIGNLASAMEGKAGAPTLLTGTGFDETHLLIVATAERGLCGGFNSSIAKLAREYADRLIAQGKTVKIFTVGKKGNDALKRVYGKYIVEHVDFRSVKQMSFGEAQAVAHKVLNMFHSGEFDVATLFFSEFKSVISQKPTALRLIPADVSGGKPAGFKLAIGHPWEFLAICKAMLKTGIYPDFIIIDGGEGGTGAAPHELPDHVGMPLVDALAFAHAALCGSGVRDHVLLGASGKIVSGFSLARAMALGADFCNAARGFMFSLGCVQSMRCHTGTCPTGITTQDPARQRAIVVPTQAQRVRNFHAATVAKLAEIVGGAGLDHPDELRPEHLYVRLTPNEIRSAADLYPQLKPRALLEAPQETPFAALWELADPERFAPKSIGERPDISERRVRATVRTQSDG